MKRGLLVVFLFCLISLMVSCGATTSSGQDSGNETIRAQAEAQLAELTRRQQQFVESRGGN